MENVKGVSKKIVEIMPQEHEYIERVFVVLKAGSPQVKIATRRTQAEKFVASLVCFKSTTLPDVNKKVLVGTAASLIILSALAVLIFLLI